jgi:hypothetical protein
MLSQDIKKNPAGAAGEDREGDEKINLQAS